MGRKYSTLNIEQRLRIKELLDNGVRKTDIATEIGVHQATVYREIDRGAVNGIYDPEWAEKQKQIRLDEKGQPAVLEQDTELAKQISDYILKEQMTVPQIAELIKDDKESSLSKTTIYRAIDENLIPGVTRESLKSNTTTVFSGGQIRLPKWIRDNMNIQDGDILSFEIVNNKLVFTKTKAGE